MFLSSTILCFHLSFSMFFSSTILCFYLSFFSMFLSSISINPLLRQSSSSITLPDPPSCASYPSLSSLHLLCCLPSPPHLLAGCLSPPPPGWVSVPPTSWLGVCPPHLLAGCLSPPPPGWVSAPPHLLAGCLSPPPPGCVPTPPPTSLAACLCYLPRLV